MENFYKNYSTPCGKYSVIGTVDTTNLVYLPELHNWKFSLFLECKNNENGKIDALWVNIFLEDGMYKDFLIESDRPLFISTKEYQYILLNVGIIRNLIDSSIIISNISERLKASKTLPKETFFDYSRSNRRAYIKFENIPFELELNLEANKGAQAVCTHFSLLNDKKSFYGCIMLTSPEFFFGEINRDNLNNLLKEKLKLKYIL